MRRHTPGRSGGGMSRILSMVHCPYCRFGPNTDCPEHGKAAAMRKPMSARIEQKSKG